MWFIIKWLIFISILAFLALVAYTYVGPYFGADFYAPQQEIRIPVELSVD